MSVRERVVVIEEDEQTAKWRAENQREWGLIRDQDATAGEHTIWVKPEDQKCLEEMLTRAGCKSLQEFVGLNIRATQASLEEAKAEERLRRIRDAANELRGRLTRKR